jgi:BMFP domain-containing protein YqiC
MREWVGGLDFVSRDEFEAVKAMAAAARDENDARRARLDALEAASKHDAPPAAAPAATPYEAPHDLGAAATPQGL